MSITNSRRTLFEWYDKYVGEAASRREVYGYWAFVLGYVLGIAGVLVYLLGPGATDSELFLRIREVAIVLSAGGLALGMLGIVFQLPVSTLGVRAAMVGAAVSLLGVAYFVSVYPGNWLGAGSPQRAVIATYVGGVALIAGVAVLVPVLTGERSFLLERDLEEEGHAIMVGEAMEGGLFAVYRRGPADWRWRLLDQEAVADGVEEFASRPDVEGAVEVVRSKVSGAGLMEINTAAFRLYGGEGTWRWDLLTEDGTGLATGTNEFLARDEAEESVSVLKEFGPTATVLTIDGAAVQVTREGTGWRWQLLDESRTSLAEGSTRYEDEHAASEAADVLRETAGVADLLAIDDVAFEIREDGADWGWRIVDGRDEELGTGTLAAAERSTVRSRIDAVRDGVGSAPILTQTEPHFELVGRGDAWSWRFVDGDDEVQARSLADGYDREAGERDVARFGENVAGAPVVEGRDEAVEVYHADDGWRWRLVDAERTVIQHSVAAAETREAAEAALEHAIDQTQAAELVEFEEAAFQLYEAENGDWRWRLIEEGGELLADSGEDYDTRDAAAAGMTTLKEHAPDAELLEIDSAAIELFRDGGEWGWRVVDEAGETIAESATLHPSKEAAKSATAAMRRTFETAEERAIDEGAFQVFERTTDGEAAWHWQFVAADGTVLAEDPGGRTTRESVTRSIEDLQSAVPHTETHAIDAFAFVLVPDREGWGWRLVDRDREPVAESTESAPEDEVTGLVETIRTHAGDAEVFELTGAVYRIRETGSEWTWDLLDADRNVVASAPVTYEERTDAERATETVADLAPDAGELEYDNAAFELFEAENGWVWRLIDEDEEALAESQHAYESREAVHDALDTVRSVVGDASLLEIESASFELHETDDESGWVWRLVDHTGETVARSVTTYETRTQAREGMQTLKDHAPEAGVVVAG